MNFFDKIRYHKSAKKLNLTVEQYVEFSDFNKNKPISIEEYFEFLSFSKSYNITLDIFYDWIKKYKDRLTFDDYQEFKLTNLSVEDYLFWKYTCKYQISVDEIDLFKVSELTIDEYIEWKKNRNIVSLSEYKTCILLGIPFVEYNAYKNFVAIYPEADYSEYKRYVLNTEGTSEIQNIQTDKNDLESLSFSNNLNFPNYEYHDEIQFQDNVEETNLDYDQQSSLNISIEDVGKPQDLKIVVNNDLYINESLLLNESKEEDFYSDKSNSFTNYDCNNNEFYDSLEENTVYENRELSLDSSFEETTTSYLNDSEIVDEIQENEYFQNEEEENLVYETTTSYLNNSEIVDEIQEKEYSQNEEEENSVYENRELSLDNSVEETITSYLNDSEIVDEIQEKEYSQNEEEENSVYENRELSLDNSVEETTTSYLNNSEIVDEIQEKEYSQNGVNNDNNISSVSNHISSRFEDIIDDETESNATNKHLNELSNVTNIVNSNDISLTLKEKNDSSNTINKSTTKPQYSQNTLNRFGFSRFEDCIFSEEIAIRNSENYDCDIDLIDKIGYIEEFLTENFTELSAEKLIREFFGYTDYKQKYASCTALRAITVYGASDYLYTSYDLAWLNYADTIILYELGKINMFFINMNCSKLDYYVSCAAVIKIFNIAFKGNSIYVFKIDNSIAIGSKRDFRNEITNNFVISGRINKNNIASYYDFWEEILFYDLNELDSIEEIPSLILYFSPQEKESTKSAFDMVYDESFKMEYLYALDEIQQVYNLDTSREQEYVMYQDCTLREYQETYHSVCNELRNVVNPEQASSFDELNCAIEAQEKSEIVFSQHQNLDQNLFDEDYDVGLSEDAFNDAEIMLKELL